MKINKSYLEQVIFEEAAKSLNEKRRRKPKYASGMKGLKHRQRVLLQRINSGPDGIAAGSNVSMMDIQNALAGVDQRLMPALKAKGGAGDYNRATRRAIMRFQKKYRKQLGQNAPGGRARIDGLVGPNTFGVMTKVFPELKKLGDQKGVTVSDDKSVLDALDKIGGANPGKARQKAFMKFAIENPGDFYKFYLQISKERKKYAKATDDERGLSESKSSQMNEQKPQFAKLDVSQPKGLESASARSTRKRDMMISDLRQAYIKAVRLMYKKMNAGDKSYKSKIENLVAAMPQVGENPKGYKEIMDLYKHAAANARKAAGVDGPKGDKRGHSAFNDGDIKKYADGLYKAMKGLGSGDAPKIIKHLLRGTDGGAALVKKVADAFGRRDGETLMQWIDGESRIPDVDKEAMRRYAVRVPMSTRESALEQYILSEQKMGIREFDYKGEFKKGVAAANKKGSPGLARGKKKWQPVRGHPAHELEIGGPSHPIGGREFRFHAGHEKLDVRKFIDKDVSDWIEGRGGSQTTWRYVERTVGGKAFKAFLEHILKNPLFWERLFQDNATWYPSSRIRLNDYDDTTWAAMKIYRKMAEKLDDKIDALDPWDGYAYDPAVRNGIEIFNSRLLPGLMERWRVFVAAEATKLRKKGKVKARIQKTVQDPPPEIELPDSDTGRDDRAKKDGQVPIPACDPSTMDDMGPGANPRCVKKKLPANLFDLKDDEDILDLEEDLKGKHGVRGIVKEGVEKILGGFSEPNEAEWGAHLVRARRNSKIIKKAKMAFREWADGGATGNSEAERSALEAVSKLPESFLDSLSNYREIGRKIVTIVNHSYTGTVAKPETMFIVFTGRALQLESLYLALKSLEYMTAFGQEPSMSEKTAGLNWPGQHRTTVKRFRLTLTRVRNILKKYVAAAGGHNDSGKLYRYFEKLDSRVFDNRLENLEPEPSLFGPDYETPEQPDDEDTATAGIGPTTGVENTIEPSDEILAGEIETRDLPDMPKGVEPFYCKTSAAAKSWNKVFCKNQDLWELEARNRQMWGLNGSKNDKAFKAYLKAKRSAGSDKEGQKKLITARIRELEAEYLDKIDADPRTAGKTTPAGSSKTSTPVKAKIRRMSKSRRQAKLSRRIGKSIKQIQIDLKEYFPENSITFRSGNPDGIYGQETEAAIIKLQQDDLKFVGDAIDGLYGPDTNTAYLDLDTKRKRELSGNKGKSARRLKPQSTAVDNTADAWKVMAATKESIENIVQQEIAKLLKEKRKVK